MILLIEHLRPLMMLNRMRFQAALNSRLRQFKSIKGLLFVAIIVTIVVYVRAGFTTYTAEQGYITAINSNEPTVWLAVGLLAACILTVFTSTSSSLHFSLAEMNILYSAPVGRAALVVNKVLSYVVGATLSSLLLVVLFPDTQLNRVLLFFAMTMSLMFVQLLSAVVSMSTVMLKKRWPILPGRQQLLLSIVVIVLMFAAVAAYFYGRGSSADLGSYLNVIYQGIIHSTVVALVMSPFSLFAGLYAMPESTLDYTYRFVLSLSILCGLVFAIVRLDDSLQDETAASSIKAHERWQSILKSGSVWQRSAGQLKSKSAPVIFGSAILIAWSQWLRLFRTAPAIAYGLPCVALIAGVHLGFFAEHLLSNRLLPPILFFLFVFMLPKTLAYDFRGAPDIIERLKTMPVSAHSICVGQLLTPVVFASALQWILMIGIIPFVSAKAVVVIIALAIIVLPFNFLLYATENAGFLLAPSRLVPVGRVDFDFLGRTLVEFLLKCLVLALAVACLVVTAWVTWVIGARSIIVTSIVLTLATLIEIMIATAVVSFTFRRFDTTALRRST